MASEDTALSLCFSVKATLWGQPLHIAPPCQPSVMLQAVSAQRQIFGIGDDFCFVQVHYCGTLDDDTIFDSSHEREPLDFIVGSGRVIPGFDDVVIGMVKGERRKERVEPDRAYGEQQ